MDSALRLLGDSAIRFWFVGGGCLFKVLSSASCFVISLNCA